MDVDDYAYLCQAARRNVQPVFIVELEKNGTESDAAEQKAILQSLIPTFEQLRMGLPEADAELLYNTARNLLTTYGAPESLDDTAWEMEVQTVGNSLPNHLKAFWIASLHSLMVHENFNNTGMIQ